MFRITTQTVDGELVLKLEGWLAGPCVQELETCWRAAVKTLGNRLLRVDLTALWRVDAAGRDLLAEMHRAGAHFIARGCVMPEVLREIAESARGLGAEAQGATARLSSEARSAKAERS